MTLGSVFDISQLKRKCCHRWPNYDVSQRNVIISVGVKRIGGNVLTVAIKRTLFQPQYISQRMSEPVRNAPAPVLEIRNAPWQNIDIASAEQFPEMAAAPVIAANTPIGAWGAQRRF